METNTGSKPSAKQLQLVSNVMFASSAIFLVGAGVTKYLGLGSLISWAAIAMAVYSLGFGLVMRSKAKKLKDEEV
jgi:hypothetical protein